MIGNAHLDPVWLWQWTEGFQETKATFRSTLDRMVEYPDFVFTNSSAANYEWVEQNDPKMFREIKERIAEGRWVIVGGWWVQPDCNIPSGESFVRQGLYGQRYFYEKFGVMAKTGYNVDSFGHNGMLPQILKKCGMDNYVFMRPGRHEKALPDNLFRWKSMDGSTVTACRIPYEYTWSKELTAHIRRCTAEIKNGNCGICFYGVGNHGGGPTRENIENIKRLDRDPSFPILIMASPEDFFKEIRSSGRDLPEVEGELLHHASGCYSANSEVKILNRRAENRLLKAEIFSVVADVIAGLHYPSQQYKRAWKDVLFNQFHDILSGTSIESAYDDVRETYGASLHTAAVNMNYAIQSVSWKIHIPWEENMKPIVVFNPNSFPGKTEVELESTEIQEGNILVDENGEPTTFQKVQPEAACNGRCRISFIADLPSMGYRTYRLVKQKNPNSAGSAMRDGVRRKFVMPGTAVKDDILEDYLTTGFDSGNCTDCMAENRFFTLELDENTGAIKSLTLRGDGTEIFSGLAALPIVIEDKSDTWSHGVRRFAKEAGTFKAKQVYCAERGSVKTVIRSISEYGGSSIVQDFTVYKELDYILVRTMVDWHEKFKMLKLRFPLNLNYIRGSFEIPYGFVQRECDGEEYPMHSWMDFEGAAAKSEFPVVGLSFINDGKTSYDANGKVVNMTILRSPIYAHHDPYVPREQTVYSFQDQGMQRFNYILYPHIGNWEGSDTVRLSLLLNQKPEVIFESCHEGCFPQTDSFLQISAPNVVVGAMKLAEDGSEDIILRLYETAGKRTDTVITIPQRDNKQGGKFKEIKIDICFKPCEIKTLRVARDGREPVKEVSMLEMGGTPVQRFDRGM